MAELPALPARGLWASTVSTGAAPRATRSVAPQGGLRRWAWVPWRSTASRPTTSPGCCRGCAISPTCRSVSTRTSDRSRNTAGERRRVSPAMSTRSSPRAGGLRGRRSSAAAVACGPSTCLPPAVRLIAPSPVTIGPNHLQATASLAMAQALTPRRGPTLAGGRLYPLQVPELDDRSGRVRSDAGQLPGVEVPVSRRGSAHTSGAWTWAVAPAC